MINQSINSPDFLLWHFWRLQSLKVDSYTAIASILKLFIVGSCKVSPVRKKLFRPNRPFQKNFFHIFQFFMFLYPLIKVPPPNFGGSPKNISKSNFWSDPRVELPVNKIIFFFISKKFVCQKQEEMVVFLCIQKVWKQCRRRLM